MNRRDMIKASAFAAVAPSFLAARSVAADGHAGAATKLATLRYQLGKAKVTAISDGYLPISSEILTGVDEDQFAVRLKEAHKAGPAALTGVNTYLIEIGEERILIDAGTGSALGETLGQLTEALSSVGVAPTDITKVIATHLHPDHIGGLMIDGVNAFTNAELVASEDDIAFWTDETIAAGAPDNFKPFFALANAAVESFGDRVTPTKGEMSPTSGLTLMPMPGHTPGHMGVMLESEGEQLLFWGDIIHVGAVQFQRPDVTLAFDNDQPQAAATRASILDMVATDGLRIAGAHIDFPGVGYVERRSEGYGWIPAAYPYGE